MYDAYALLQSYEYMPIGADGSASWAQVISSCHRLTSWAAWAVEVA